MDKAWLQATFQKAGWIMYVGVHRAAQVAPSAYLSYSVLTAELSAFLAESQYSEPFSFPLQCGLKVTMKSLPRTGASAKN